MKYGLLDKIKIAVLVIFLILDICYLWDMIYGAYLFLRYPSESGYLPTAGSDPPKAVFSQLLTIW